MNPANRPISNIVEVVPTRPDDQHTTAAGSAQHINADERRDHRDDAVQDIRKQCRSITEPGPEPGLGQDPRPVIHDRIDARDLLDDANPDPQQKYVPHPGGRHGGPPMSYARFLALRETADFLQFPFRGLGCTQHSQRPQGIGHALSGSQPTRTLRHHQHAEAQNHGWQDRNATSVSRRKHFRLSSSSTRLIFSLESPLLVA
jgi:hypothetical protein